MWLGDLIRGRHRPSVAVHNALTPRQTISAVDWQNDLLASEESIDEAIRTAKLSGSFFSGLSESADELIAHSRKGGWEIEIYERDKRQSSYFVKRNSKWAGKRIERSNFGYVFGKRPKEKMTDAQAKAIAMSFFGLVGGPTDLATATIARPQRPTQH